MEQSKSCICCKSGLVLLCTVFYYALYCVDVVDCTLMSHVVDSCRQVEAVFCDLHDILLI